MIRFQIEPGMNFCRKTQQFVFFFKFIHNVRLSFQSLVIVGFSNKDQTWFNLKTRHKSTKTVVYDILML